MTWHFFDGENIECASCGAEFIPFENAQPCPKCGTPSSKHFQFLDDVVSAMRIHRGQYGRYTPNAYFVGSAAESVFYLASQCLDAIEEKQDQINESIIATVLGDIDWGEYQYMQRYFQLLLQRVSEKLKEDRSDDTEK